MSFRTLSLGLLALLASCAAMGGPVYAADLYSVRYVDCYDGDTCTFIVPYLPEPFTTLKVRLAGIDAPEIHGDCRQEKTSALHAKAALNRWLAKAKTIDLRDVQMGIYGRVVATVVMDGQQTAQSRLLAESLAVVSEGPRSHSWCEASG